MVTRLVVETEDFAAAARSVSRDVVQPMSTAVLRLESALAGSGSVAGSDPGGVAWARGYDRAAREVLAATSDVVNGAATVSQLLAATARNYERAESASTAGGGTSVADLAGLPGAACVGTAPPSVSGGSDAPPSGWGKVAHLVGYVWPNGHQDRLRLLADSWRAAAVAVQEPAGMAQVMWVPFLEDSLPEADDVRLVCGSVHRQTDALSSTFDTLARACDEYADHLDRVHHQVIGELESLADWTVGIEGAGAAFAILSFGASEGAAQVSELARASVAASRIASMIEKFTAAARVLAEAIPSVEQAALGIRTSMEGLLGARLAYAGLEGARALPATSRIARAEMVAADHLAAEGTTAAGSAAGPFADKAAARAALPDVARSAGNKFFRGATAKCRDFRIVRLDDGGYRLEFFAPARNEGYGKLYVQVVDADGVQVAEFKDTMGPDGLIERKFVPRGD